ncbi:hypothetical protein FM107_08820 [Sphingobacterium sp. JB170]|nr:hypothetical protein FM107_08820 [Sphingobacterium sp. JB170]
MLQRRLFGVEGVGFGYYMGVVLIPLEDSLTFMKKREGFSLNAATKQAL